MTPTYAVELAAVEPGGWLFLHAGRERCAAVSGGDAVFDGRPATALGAAVEVYSRKGGRSTWGHLSVRFIGCQDGEYVDAEYEFYRFDRSTPEVLAGWLPAAEVLRDPDWTRRQRGAMIVYRNENPADDGDFATASAENREIYELWLDQPQAERDAWWTAMEGSWSDQVVALDARADLTERYRPLTDNCTRPTRVAFGERTGLPHAWKRWLFDTGRVRHAVVYPSAWALRKLARRAGGIEALVASRPVVSPFHPVFRWSGRLPEGVEGLTTLAGPLATPRP